MSMSQTLPRKDIAALVRAALTEQLSGAASRSPAPVAEHAAPAAGSQLVVKPSTVANPHDKKALAQITAATPARVGVGRAGTRYTTATLLRFRADHAAAKEAVLSEVKSELLARLGVLEVRSRADDKRHFLQRPDAGRALSDPARALIAERLPKRPQLQIIYGDGLSAEAINTNLEALHGALEKELAARGIKPNPPLFIHLSRVKIMDEVARLLECEACLFICGERPGLGFADSLSAYYIYRPSTGATDADREVISNINPRGFPPAQAAQKIADSIVRILRDKKSGVVFA